MQFGSRSEHGAAHNRRDNNGECHNDRRDNNGERHDYRRDNNRNNRAWHDYRRDNNGERHNDRRDNNGDRKRGELYSSGFQRVMSGGKQPQWEPLLHERDGSEPLGN